MFLFCTLSESDILLEAARRSVLAAVPVGGPAEGAAGAEPGRVVGDPLLHQETGAQTAAGGQRHPAAESRRPGD